MDRIQYLNLLLEEVGNRDGIAGLRLAPDGTGGIALKNGVCVYFEYVQAADRLYVYSPLKALPASDDERLRLFDAMLAANFDQPGSGTTAIVYGHAVYRTTHLARDHEPGPLSPSTNVPQLELPISTDRLRPFDNGALKGRMEAMLQAIPRAIADRDIRFKSKQEQITSAAANLLKKVQPTDTRNRQQLYRLRDKVTNLADRLVDDLVRGTLLGSMLERAIATSGRGDRFQIVFDGRRYDIDFKLAGRDLTLPGRQIVELKIAELFSN